MVVILGAEVGVGVGVGEGTGVGVGLGIGLGVGFGVGVGPGSAPALDPQPVTNIVVARSSNTLTIKDLLTKDLLTKEPRPNRFLVVPERTAQPSISQDILFLHLEQAACEFDPMIPQPGEIMDGPARNCLPAPR